MKFKNLLLVAIFFVTATVKAQQLPNYSQYTFNKFLINPSYAGAEGYTVASFVAREQWVGIKEAPRTHALMIQSRILPQSFVPQDAPVRKRSKKLSRSGRVGWGAYIFNDRNGLMDRSGIKGTYSYHIDMWQGQVSFGLSGIFYQLKVDHDRFIPDDPNVTDNVLAGIKKPLYIPDADFGVSYLSDDYYGGYSVNQILQSSVQFGQKGEGQYRLKRQHNFMAGYRYFINDYWIVLPSFWLKLPEGTKAQLDISARASYKDMYWGGLSFRTGSSLIVFGGANVDRYYFGYAFDYTFNDIMGYTYGSHEIMMSVKFGDSARRYKWLNTY
jgi:type IX secretion system PorP/SprF family membrane protein